VTVSKADSRKQSDPNKRKKSSKGTASRRAGKKAKSAGNLSAQPAEAIEQTSEIPKFDLAGQILAEQRKIAAIRRKGPGRKVEAPKQRRQVESARNTIKPPPTLPEQEQIIAEIVARDIEKLRRKNEFGG
jgi:hypothetical protein